MNELEIVKRLCVAYGLDINEAIILSGIDDTNISQSQSVIQLNNTENKSSNSSAINNSNIDIKPFDGIVRTNCCKAVVYNHGLYTQCTVETSREFCSSICKRLKYGHINVRKDYPVGNYVLENGKKEISYQKVKKRLEKNNILSKNDLRIITHDSDEDFEETRESRDISISKNPRVRPKMPTKKIEVCIDSKEKILEDVDDDDNIEEVLVKREMINGVQYLVSEQNVVFDQKTYKMIGRLLMGKIMEV